ncbi:SAM-dependent methyltransferase, partial [Gammaproteobacteria bacterium]|nr:SAM-dependent methyltransferase [Gammaproteobacteria bacterium]
MVYSVTSTVKRGVVVLGSAALSLIITLPTLAAENPGYIEDQLRRTTGIGKFYMGREISFVMGHQAAGWLNRPG